MNDCKKCPLPACDNRTAHREVELGYPDPPECWAGDAAELLKLLRIDRDADRARRLSEIRLNI